MNAVRLVACGCLIVTLVGCGGSPTTKPPELSNKDKIVGVWDFVKSSDQGSLPPGSTFEFTKDGKMKITIQVGDKRNTMEGSYEVEGDSLKSKPPGGEKEETSKIKTLTDKELVLEDK